MPFPEAPPAPEALLAEMPAPEAEIPADRLHQTVFNSAYDNKYLSSNQKAQAFLFVLFPTKF